MTTLALTEREGVGDLMRRATDVAGVCREIVTKTARNIQGRRYVQVEGWQSIASAFGCTISISVVEACEGGIRAVAQLLRQPDGAIIGQAEGFVGDDESMWAKRPLYARRAMAQTRATSRVCRSVFAFVVTLIDAGLSTTPAEEMDFVDAAPSGPQPRSTPQNAPAMVAALEASIAQQTAAIPWGSANGAVSETDKLLAAIRESPTERALESLTPRIRRLPKGEQESLRAAYGARRDELRKAGAK